MPRKTNETKKELGDSLKKQKTSKVKATTKTNLKAKTSTKKGSSKQTNSTLNINKKTTTKKSTTAKASSRTKKKSSVAKTNATDFVEYYDLPYRYHQTTVKILAQTPKILFVYWDISDEDRLQYITKYGDDFFAKTRPVLLVHNETMNYTFEVEINDFANSWYLQVADVNCTYTLELGRRPNFYQDTIKEDYIYVTSSNQMDAPNDHILFEKFNPNHVEYKNVKTGTITSKDFSHLSKFQNMQKIYGIYDFYQQIYQNELLDEMVEGNLSNPSSYSSSRS